MKKNKESVNEVQNRNKYELKMKNAKLQDEIHFAKSRRSFSNMNGTRAYVHVGKYLKIFSYLILLTGFTLLLNSCMGGYMASQPAYVDYARPQRPSNVHIWIDGDWRWNNQQQLYIQKTGYWEIPRKGHSYVAGVWTTNQYGKTWSKGYWQRDNQQRDNQQRGNRQKNNRQRNDLQIDYRNR